MNITNEIQNPYRSTYLKKGSNTTNPNPRNTLQIRIQSNPCEAQYLGPCDIFM